MMCFSSHPKLLYHIVLCYKKYGKPIPAGEHITLVIPTGSEIPVSAFLKSEILAALFTHIFC